MAGYKKKFLFLLVLSTKFLHAQDPTQPWTMNSYYPPWASAAAKRIIILEYETGKSETENGQALFDAVAALIPGDKLQIGAGTWSVNRLWSLEVQGTSADPIWIVAADGTAPVITRPDANQNLVNIGANSKTEYLCIRGLDFFGGSRIIRIQQADNLWIDNNIIHDGNGVGISANSNDNEYLYITRNEIYNPGGPQETSEGMYLGSNNSATVMRYSIIAQNLVHDAGGTQGDGIEVKQGSYNNWIAENRVYSTNYPCILVYGTDGNGINVIERNIINNSNDNTMQVQGEARVYNNLIMSGGSAFASTNHQGTTTNLHVIHNTIINTGTGASLSSWNGKENMVFANNVVYSRNGNAIAANNGLSGVIVSGNVILGGLNGVTGGTVEGSGLDDFIAVTWDSMEMNAGPSTSSAVLGKGDPDYALVADLMGNHRVGSVDAGAFDEGSSTSIFKGIQNKKFTSGKRMFVNLHRFNYQGRLYNILGRLSGKNNIPAGISIPLPAQ